MNSTRLFNLKFFIENLKKSKSSIIFLAILLPLFTFLGTQISNSLEYSYVMGFADVSLSNILFMYIIPVALSIVLFNYVFKKNSADLVCSLPVSRTSLFTTNTIGGIILIVLIRLVTAIILQFASVISNNVVIFSAIIWESFLYFTVAYIFVFIVCNLAMSFSGNMFATIASAMLILFLIPFIITCSRADVYLHSDTIFGEYASSKGIEVYDNYNYTAPSYFLDSMVNGNEYYYNTHSMIKMIVLSVIYCGLGAIIFNRKKLEMAEESYESDTAHLFIKFLTLTPFFAIAEMTEVYKSLIAFCFFFAIVGVYYFLFDVITKKRIKLIKSIITFVIFSLIMYAIFALVVPAFSFIGYNCINPNKDIAKIEIESLPNNIQVHLVIDDKDIINSLFKDPNDFYSYIVNNNNTWQTNIKVTTTNGKEFYVHSDIWTTLEKINKKYGDEKVDLSIDDEVLVLTERALSKAEQKELKEIINREVSNITYRELFKKAKDYTTSYNLSAISYKNHRLYSSYLTYLGLKDSTNYVVSLINNDSYNGLGGYYHLSMGYYGDFEDYVLEKNPDLYSDDDYYFPLGVEYDNSGEEYKSEFEYETYKTVMDVVYDGINELNRDAFKEYVMNHKDDQFDITKPYYTIDISGGLLNQSSFLSNDIEGFYKIFAASYNESRSEDTGIVLNLD